MPTSKPLPASALTPPPFALQKTSPAPMLDAPPPFLLTKSMPACVGTMRRNGGGASGVVEEQGCGRGRGQQIRWRLGFFSEIDLDCQIISNNSDQGDCRKKGSCPRPPPPPPSVLFCSQRREMVGKATVAARAVLVVGTSTTEARCCGGELRRWQGSRGRSGEWGRGTTAHETTVAEMRLQRRDAKAHNGWAATAALLQWW